MLQETGKEELERPVEQTEHQQEELRREECQQRAGYLEVQEDCLVPGLAKQGHRRSSAQDGALEEEAAHLQGGLRLEGLLLVCWSFSPFVLCMRLNISRDPTWLLAERAYSRLELVSG